jgi:hypothetical protein
VRLSQLFNFGTLPNWANQSDVEPAAENIFLSRPPFAFVNGARGNRPKHGNKSFGHGCPLTAAVTF